MTDKDELAEFNLPCDINEIIAYNEKIIRLEYDLNLKDKLLQQIKQNAKRNHFEVLKKENVQRHNYFSKIFSQLEMEIQNLESATNISPVSEEIKNVIEQFKSLFIKFNKENESHYLNNEQEIVKKIQEIEKETVEIFDVNIDNLDLEETTNQEDYEKEFKEEVKKEIDIIKTQLQKINDDSN